MAGLRVTLEARRTSARWSGASCRQLEKRATIDISYPAITKPHLEHIWVSLRRTGLFLRAYFMPVSLSRYSLVRSVQRPENLQITRKGGMLMCTGFPNAEGKIVSLGQDFSGENRN